MPMNVSKSEHEHEYKHTQNKKYRGMGRTPVGIYIYILSLHELTQRVFKNHAFKNSSGWRRRTNLWQKWPMRTLKATCFPI